MSQVCLSLIFRCHVIAQGEELLSRWMSTHLHTHTRTCKHTGHTNVLKYTRQTEVLTHPHTHRLHHAMPRQWSLISASPLSPVSSV